LTRLKWPGGGLMNTMVFSPWTTKLVMSKGPKLANWFLNAGLSPSRTVQGGRLATNLSLTRMVSWPTPLSQSSMSKPWKVKTTA